MDQKKTCILLVEDKEEHIELILRALESQGDPLDLTIARTLQEARSILATTTPDLVLADLYLPDGEAIQLLHGREHDLLYPVVILTAWGNQEAAVRAMKHGAQDYVVKSEATFADIPHIVARALREWNNHVERRGMERQFRELIESAPDAMVIVDDDGKIVIVNAETESLFGYSRDELIGQTVETLLPHSFRDKHVALRKKFFRGRANRPMTFAPDLSALRKDGVEIPVEISLSHIITGETHLVASAIRDITERRREERERAQLEAHLQQTQKMDAIGRLAGGIAHDFNNILTGIIGFTESAVEQTQEGSQLRADLEEVLKAAQRAELLTADILSFARKSERKRESVVLADVVVQATKFLRSSIPSSVDIKTFIDVRSSTILGDATRLHQVLLNLGINAADAMREEGGTLHVVLEEFEVTENYAAVRPTLSPGPHLRLRLSDTGTGIRPEILDRIFDPYFTTKEVGKGTGIGLSIVRSIIEEHDGLVEVESVFGQGTKFLIYLPHAGSTPKPEIVKNSPSRTGTERILFVDDEEMIVRLFVRTLGIQGYRVVGEIDSVDALEAFRAEPNSFDLIITDLTMPKMCGDRLAREIHDIRSDVPIILCSGFNESTDEEQALSLGIRRYLKKPITSRMLSETIRAVLDEK